MALETYQQHRLIQDELCLRMIKAASDGPTRPAKLELQMEAVLRCLWAKGYSFRLHRHRMLLVCVMLLLMVVENVALERHAVVGRKRPLSLMNRLQTATATIVASTNECCSRAQLL